MVRSRRRWRGQLSCRHVVRCHHERRRGQHRRSPTGRRNFIIDGMGRFGSRGSGIGSNGCLLTGGQSRFAAAASSADTPVTATADPRRSGWGRKILAVQGLEVGPLRTRRCDAGRWRDDPHGVFGRWRRLGRLPLLVLAAPVRVGAVLAAVVAVTAALHAEFALATGRAARAAGSANVARSAPAARVTRRAAGQLSIDVVQSPPPVASVQTRMKENVSLIPAPPFYSLLLPLV
mmetsp:Transcript_9369/g.19755  ORF Transcript_9369/g.19755 Transcript_9369/m.19755 type:complete len:233 (+) Transcript_9369:753-1451(+)